MQISQRTIVIVLLIIFTIWVLYLVRPVLAPFILGAIFAYLLSPIVCVINVKLKLPKLLSVLIVFISVIALITLISADIGIRLAHESRLLAFESRSLTRLMFDSLKNVPVWLREWITESISTLNFDEMFSPQKIWPYFSGALSGIGTLFIFLISGFYFLKEGDVMFEKVSSSFPAIDKVDIAILLRKISSTFSNYLRGQVFLIILMSSLSIMGLTILGVKYALIIGIFTGFAEIIPFIGPIVAGAVAVIVAMFDNFSPLGFNPLTEGIIVASMYFLFRQLEDIFVIPFILGHATKLHPLIVLFAVLAGGHLWGVMGMILAVPLAAIIRILLEFLLSKIA